MKYIKFLIVGVLFGIVLTKSELISWYRIQEMFLFDSFHMYGTIGSAVALGALGVFIIKRIKLKAYDGSTIAIAPKEKGIPRYLIGGTIFGLGWALTGACPGPIYAHIGQGSLVFIVVMLSALVGTFTYGLVKNYLPHG